jgi:leucyl aminopeptidase
LPIDVHVTLLPADGPSVPKPDDPGVRSTDGLSVPSVLSGYLSAVSGGGADPPGLLAVLVPPDGSRRDQPDLDPFLPVGAAAVLAAAEMTGTAGEVAEAASWLGSGATRVLFVGTGDAAPRALRRAGAALGRRTARAKAVSAVAIEGLTDEAVQALVTGILLGSYAFSLKSAPSLKSAAAEERGGEVILLTGRSADYAAAVGRGITIAEAVALARDLTNMPSAVKSPEWLAGQAAAVAARTGLRSRVWAEGELSAAGFGGILAVGSGSARPPRLIELSYEPAGWDTHVVLVGKGITFDSGGLSLKPSDGMKLMKTDMAGGAAVIAVMSALNRLDVRAKVTGLVAAAENMPSGSAYRPGDVITQYGGRSVEVLNTDAEGRLVLADAIAYADAELDPGVLVDIATLTGAARIALGAGIGALYSTDDSVAAALLAAGQATGDRLWRMPLPADYLDALDSPVADLAHVARAGAAGARAGSIAAALFLREFTGGRPWAHLDVAGPARAAADDGEITKGGTGFGTGLLLSWLGRI